MPLSTGAKIGITIGIVILVIVIILVVFLFVGRSGGNTGNTGSTGNTGITSCTSQCTTIPEGCIATNSLKIGFAGATGFNCPNSCITSSQNISLQGCVLPVCSSQYCTPQQALFTNLNSNGSLYNICNSGGVTGGLNFSNPSCNLQITGDYLVQLPMYSTRTSGTNPQIRPIFITTINKSIYGTEQPVAPPGISQDSIKINNVDPTVVNDPYLLVLNNSLELQFLRKSFIIQNNFINRATWIYNTDTKSITLFSDLNSGINTNSGLISFTVRFPFVFIYTGANPPCSYIYYGLQSGNSTIVYDANSGLFQVTQMNLDNNYSATLSFLVGPADAVTTTAAPGVEVAGAPCPFTDITRWYAIDATFNYLVV